ncbi:DUF222 domain-containing protein [Streptomyces sp. NP160]|uniref:HNH endonuclease signature motif containing protein n=1 Tax=Streptomyces sp. NP160 TaxID=2586637 RepID=UPI0011180F9B|nr:HNH endonuclease signature motif containing protein [Streptomyces sp. NP160]TNM59480.1 DUF222 domain-containing protein [Streptomyces sp. NP160]
MTWTGTETPHDGGVDGGGAGDGAAGGGGGAAWQAEPLPPGALGADLRPASEREDGALLAELPPLPLAGPLAEALATAQAGADAAADAARYLASIGPEQRLQALQQTARTRDVLDAALVRCLATFTPEQVRALGATSLVDLVLTHTGASPQRAGAEVKLASALTAPVAPLTGGGSANGDGDHDGDAPASAGGPGGPMAGTSQVGLGRVGAVHAAGRLSTDVAALAQRTVADLPARIRREHGPTADATLAEVLPGLTHAQARTVCTTLAHRLDPDRADRGFDPDDIDKRYLTYTVHEDGTVEFRGRLDPVTGAEFKAAIDHLSRPEPTVSAPLAPDQDPLPGLDGSGDDAAAASAGEDDVSGRSAGRSASQPDGGTATGVPVRDQRTAPQRRADALARVVRAGRASDETRGGEPARVIVTTTDAALRGEPGADPAHCETTGRALSTAQLRVLACSGSLQAVRLSCEGADATALSLGRAVRLFSAGQRRAMLARDGGCAIPGCTAPPGWLEAHHTHEWAAGGPTDVSQGVLLCTRHHVLVTIGVWAVRMVDGVPHVRPPRTVDPLRRWVINPRRGLRERTVGAVQQVLLEPPDGWRDDPPDLPPPPGTDAPDIPSTRSTCGC